MNRECRAFTLIELLVAVALLVVVIVSISGVFATTNRAVRAGHTTAEANANARAVLRQIAADVTRIDRDGFLVIRATGGDVGGGLAPRRSYLSFLAHGDFANRTGGMDSQSSPFAGELRSHAAHIWYGHALTRDDYDNNRLNNAPSTFLQNDPGQLNDRAMGLLDSKQQYNMPVLARHVFVMMPPDNANNANVLTTAAGGSVPAHADIRRTGAAISVGANELPARPSSGRTGVASLSPGQLMARVRYEKFQRMGVPAYDALNASYSIIDTGANARPLDGGFTEPLAQPIVGWRAFPPYDGSDYWYEARHYCYPFRVTRSPLEGTNAANARDVINGLYRSSSTLLKNCTVFVVDWTDGSTDNAGNLVWFGEPDLLQLTGNAGNGKPAISHVEWRRQQQAASPQWPPADFFNQSFGTGYTQDGLYPPLSDRADSIRNELRTIPSGYYTGTPYAGRTQMLTRDNYTAIFSFDTRRQWPKALRITLELNMTGADVTAADVPDSVTKRDAVYSRPTKRFTQLIWLPQ